MRLVELGRSDAPSIAEPCDVCIIGAGAAGCYLASRLSDLGLSVVVLEAGGRGVEDARISGIEADSSQTAYRGATDGRAFGLGGTTSLWGGQLVPHTALDVREEDPGRSAVWRHVASVVSERAPAAARHLGLGRAIDFQGPADRFLRGALDGFREVGLQPVVSDWLPFRKRNLTHLLERASDVRIYVRAVASAWRVEEAPEGRFRIARLEAVGPGGRKLGVAASAYVVAAGGIESPRILLELDRQFDQRLFASGAPVGRYLSDHLSCRIAEFPGAQRAAAIRLFGPHFLGGRMRSLRFVQPDSMRTPRAFFHFIFAQENPGFAVARKLLAGLQARRLPTVSSRDLIAAASGLGALAWHRIATRRLYVAPDTPCSVQMDMEQHPSEANRVELGSERDRYGRYVPVIRWSASAEDLAALSALAADLVARWWRLPSNVPRIEQVQVEASGFKPFDAFHPVGTCSMGEEGSSVVDTDLRVHGSSNLYVLSTAVFPTAGTANPTFSMLCLGEALAGKLAP